MKLLGLSSIVLLLLLANLVVFANSFAGTVSSETFKNAIDLAGTQQAAVDAKSAQLSAADASRIAQYNLMLQGISITLTPIIVAWIANKAKKPLAAIEMSTAQTAVSSESAKISAEKTATSIEKVHVAVNSERTAMTDEIRQLRETILQLTESKVRAEQNAVDVTAAAAAAAAAKPEPEKK